MAEPGDAPQEAEHDDAGNVGEQTTRIERNVLGAIEARTGKALPRLLLPADTRTQAAGDSPPQAAPWTGALASLGNQYQIVEVIGQGGMGVVMRARDVNLGRDVAMKVLREELWQDPVALARFVEEAQIGGQLQHPGIVPVFELGLGEDAERPYFTMRLIKGETLHDLLDRREHPSEESQRFLGIFLQLCLTIAYAHSRGVIHRDLKPSNVMVGSFGEVQVVDWGLAKVVGQPESDPGRPATSHQETVIRTGRSEPGSQGSVAGMLMGTPAYMPPEQALGLVAKVDQRSDVFALGAILCQILTGSPPYLGEEFRTVGEAAIGELANAHARLDAAAADRELVRLARECMAPAQESRPADASIVARRVEEFLAATQERAQQAKLEAATAQARAEEERRARLQVEAAREREAEARKAEAEERHRAEEARAQAEAHLQSYLRLADVKSLERCVEDEEDLHPALPERVPAMEAWLERARELAARLPAHEAALVELRYLAMPYDAAGQQRDRTSHARFQEWESASHRLDALDAQLEKLESGEELAGEDGEPLELATVRLEHEAQTTRLQELEQIVSARRTWRFESDDQAFMHDVLQELVEDLRQFSGDEPCPATVRAVETRLDCARTVMERSMTSPAARLAWAEATAAVARHPAYGGLVLAPQIGLLPLGADPVSGLWEFVHLQSGEVPERDDGRSLVRTDLMGIVLVLIPGGDCWLGAQSGDPGGHHFEPLARGEEGPVHRVSLAPYLLGKYPVTQGQWLRCAGENPSYYSPGSRPGGVKDETTLLHPVENVSWDECSRMLRQQALDLPTEAQWEHACRAGTETSWWTGNDVKSLEGAVNIPDQTFVRAGGNPVFTADFPELDDGFAMHSPAGHFRPNPWGLHDVHGNVSEWCRDQSGSYETPAREGDGERLVPATSRRAVRGGAWSRAASDCRSAKRAVFFATIKSNDLGVRASRPVQ